jgi:hypothetical protein
MQRMMDIPLFRAVIGVFAAVLSAGVTLAMFTTTIV